MYYYILYFYFFMLSVIAYDKNFRYLKKAFVVSIFLLLYVTMIFRDDSVSPDQEKYRIIFENYTFPSRLSFDNFWYSHVDILYGLLNGLVKSIGLGYREFIYFYSFLNLSVLFYGLNSLCKRLEVSLIWTITFYFSHFFLYREILQVRAGLAYATCIAALYFFISKQKLLFYFLVLLAALIHKSAIIFLCLPIWVFFVDRVGLFMALIIMLGTLLSVSFLIPIYANIMLGDIAAQTYINSINGEFVRGLGLLNPTLLKYFCLMIASNIYIRKHRSRGWEIIISVYSMAFLVSFSLSNYYVLSSRLASLFAIVEPLIIAKLLSIWVSSQRNMAVKSLNIILGFTLGFLLLGINVDVKNVINEYKFSIN